jgi:hypothetical protein
MDKIMTQTVSPFEGVFTLLRHMLLTNPATAQSIDRHAPWRRIAMKAIHDGHIESADEFVRFVDACLGHLAFEPATCERAYTTEVRNLADAIARKWACGNSIKCTPTTYEIAGLLQSEWVTLGHFRSRRSAIN